MKDLDAILADIDSSEDEIIRTVIEMNSIPALSPAYGGDGESKKADYLMTKTSGFDEVVRVDVPDLEHNGIIRSSILAKKKGKKPGTVWMVAHIDVVPAGDPELWDSPPFKPELRDGKIYGRGTEDNGQSVISSMFASRYFLDEELNGMSLGIAWVADEENGSKYGVQYLINNGYFSKDDIIMVPDAATIEGKMIYFAEKSLLWLKFTIDGKSTHASIPSRGINTFKVSSMLIMDLIESFQNRFDSRLPLYIPQESTFEPTTRTANECSPNIIPGHDEFYIDIRLNPEYDIDLVIKMAEEIAEVYAEASGAKITVEAPNYDKVGKPSSLDSIGYMTLSDSIESVIGSKPEPIGMGGRTCANYFRRKGWDAYAWQYGGGSLHAPNEYVEVKNLIIDTKVYATLFHKLCL